MLSIYDLKDTNKQVCKDYRNNITELCAWYVICFPMLLTFKTPDFGFTVLGVNLESDNPLK